MPSFRAYLPHGLRLLFASTVVSGAAQAQSLNLENADLARGYFSSCAKVANGVASDQLSSAKETCKSAMDDIAGLFGAYSDHSPMDLNVLAIYSGASAYVVVALDMQLNTNRLSADGCNHVFHVEKMYDSLTDGTSDEVMDVLRPNAETAKEHLIPWCRNTYGSEK